MINAIILQISRKGKDIFLLHLWEHCIIKIIEKYINNEHLHEEGILLSASTFLDATTIEIYYPNNKLTDILWKIIENSFTQISVEVIKKELDIMAEEISYIDISEEEKFLYKGLEFTESDSILNLYKNNNKDSEFLYEELLQFKNSISICYIYNNNIEIKQVAQNKDLNCLRQDINSSLVSNSSFANIDLSFEVSNFKDYILGYLLCFIIGMTEDSILQKEYLDKNNKYLGYSQYVMYENRAHILSLIDISELKIESAKKILDYDISENKFEKYKNSFKTYLGLYVSIYDLGKMALKYNKNEIILKEEDILDTVSSIVFEEVELLYKQLKESVYVKDVS